MSKTNSKPTHEIFAVSERKDQKSIWTKIGAAWPHADGEGFNTKLEFLPLNGASIVLRVRTDKPEQADTTKGGA